MSGPGYSRSYQQETTVKTDGMMTSPIKPNIIEEELKNISSDFLLDIKFVLAFSDHIGRCSS